MKAVVYETYGGPDVLQMRDLPKPVPRDDEVLVRVHFTSVTVGDYRARSLVLPAGFGPLGRLMFGLVAPRNKVLGYEVAGVIEAIGSAVSRFKIGDEIFGAARFGFGGYAEYIALKETAPMALRPKNLPLAQAVALPFGGETAMHFLRAAKLQRGERVLINGASGSVGTALVQLARHAGAEVTGVCSTGNIDLVRSLGADHVIDYTREDFAASGPRWDAVFDCVGNAKIDRCVPVLADNGRYVAVVSDLAAMLAKSFQRPGRGITLIGGGFKETAEDMRELAALVEAGHYTPYVDRTYPLAEIVDAHRYVDTGRKRGNVVIRVVD